MVARIVAVVLVLAGTLFSPAFADGSTPGDDPSTEPTTEPTTSPTTEPPLPQIVVRERPRVSGTVRFGRQVTRTVGKYSVSSLTLNTVWLRDGKAIPGARSAKYKIQVRDVGHQISVRVTARRAGFLPVTSESKKRTAKHVRDVRRTVKYTVVTRGAITTNVQTFRRQVDETLNDPRGWRAAGIKFTQVKSGGSMTVVLAQASKVPTFSSGCSPNWSCRVGRNVIINQERWKHASGAWNAAKGSDLRGYRHMVVNHETGHWLGWHHKSCGGKGKLASVMMQQSKGLKGCKFNSWPKGPERNVPRFR